MDTPKVDRFNSYCTLITGLVCVGSSIFMGRNIYKMGWKELSTALPVNNIVEKCGVIFYVLSIVTLVTTVFYYFQKPENDIHPPLIGRVHVWLIACSLSAFTLLIISKKQPKLFTVISSSQILFCNFGTLTIGIVLTNKAINELRV